MDWGINCPVDKDFKIYVWIDALTNYISAAGKKGEYWPADCHVIGKGINWFHTVIWPAILFSAGYKMPKKVWVHGYLTVNGQKMSKSLGNVVNPLDLIKKYPVDAIRYFFLREIPVGHDGDFNEDTLKERFNNELANKLGNLVSRLGGIANKGDGKIVKTNVDSALANKLNLPLIKDYMEKYQPDRALYEIFNFLVACNEYVQQKQPWALEGKERNAVLYTLTDSLRIATILLWPFIPESAEKINELYGFAKPKLENAKFGLTKSGKIKKGEILFKKIED